MKKLFTFFICLTLTFMAEGHKFIHYSINEGLSHNTVLAVTQDSLGRMWFGTLDGLNVYDGSEFRVFKHNSNPSSLGDNKVKSLLIDSSNRLWIGTEVGLSIFDNKTLRFDNYYFNTDVTSIVELDPNTMMFATGKGLMVYDANTMEERKVGSDIFTSITALSLYKYDNKVFIGTIEGHVFVYSIDSKDINRLSFCQLKQQIQTLLVQSDNVVWAGTEGNGLWRLNLEDSTCEQWTQNSRDRILSNYVRSLYLDSESRLWIGTFRGLNIYDGQSFEEYESHPFEPDCLSRSSIRAIYGDRDGGIWLGTYFGGVNYTHEFNERFSLMRMLPKKESLSDNVISCIKEDSDGTLWIGTNTGGVNHYDPVKETFCHYKFTNDMKGMESNDIKDIFMDEFTGNIYVGAHAGGLYMLNRNNWKMQLCSSEDSRNINVYSILNKSKTELWIGSLGGLFSYNKYTRRFVQFDKDVDGNPLVIKSIKILFRDSEGRMWIAGDSGVAVYTTENEVLRKVDFSADGSLSSLSYVNCISESSDGYIWIATYDGLYRFNTDNLSLIHYTEEDGLPDNIVNSIEEDKSGLLWLGTSNGLGCFNPYTGVSRNFSIEDGLQSNQFNMYAHCYTSKGVMYFGGINGLTYFHPEKIQDNTNAAQPILTGMRVFSSKSTEDEGNNFTNLEVAYADKIDLKHYQNTFTIFYSVPNYTSLNKVGFAYRLIGLDEEWRFADNKRSVTYHNIRPGSYTFQLAAANNDLLWNENPIELKIKIATPWYSTILAKIVYILLAFVIIGLFIKFFLERAILKNKLKLEQKDREQQNELHEMKMRFFINISHELRTPLTMIINPLNELMSRESDGWKRKQIKYAEKNARRLLHLVNQLMDYRRAELGVFKLRVRPENVHKIIQDSWSYYENVAKDRKIKYRFISDIEGTNLYVDSQYLELILTNLLSNAFKYTDMGIITVKAYLEKNQLILKVIDTGCGIPENMKDKIFDRFYQGDNHNVGSGIGLSLVKNLVELHHGTIHVESRVGEGSSFIVSLPQDLKSYTEEELVPVEEQSNSYRTSYDETFIMPMDSNEEIDLPVLEGNKRCVLIAESNEEVRNYMQVTLANRFDVVAVENGQEALDYLHDNNVDLIVSDSTLSGIDGLALCTAVKHNIDTSHIPVIIISAKTDNVDQLDAMRKGADAYIFKPFSIEVLVYRMQNILRTSMRIENRATNSMDISPEKISFNAGDEKFLNQALSVVKANIENPKFSTLEFASELSISRSNLHNKLKALTGESALDFIRKVRFQEACELLKENTYTVSEISDKIGFSSPAYFATSFKKYMGCNPTDYAKNSK